MAKLVLPDLSYQVVGVCMKVHRELGTNLLEKYYQRAVEIEFRNMNMKYKREISVNLIYENVSIGRYFVDFLIDDRIILELKAQKTNNSVFYRQVLAYLRQLNLPLGIVVNFREPTLMPKRIINSKWSGFEKIRIN